MSGDSGSGANGLLNGASRARPKRTTPFELNEALPYSPHASVVPFLTEYIPEPSIGSGPTTQSLGDVFDSKPLDVVNQEASLTPGLNTKKMRYAMDSILHDLRPMEQTRYKFRHVRTSIPATESPGPLSTKLSPFSKAVHDKFSTFIRKKEHGAPNLTTAGAEGTMGSSMLGHVNENHGAHLTTNPHPHHQNSIEITIPTTINHPEKRPKNNASSPSTPRPVRSHPALQAEQSQPPPHLVARAQHLPGTPSPKLKREAAGTNSESPFAITMEPPPPPAADRHEFVRIEDTPDKTLTLSARKGERARSDSQGRFGADPDAHQRAQAAVRELASLTRAIRNTITNASDAAQDSNSALAAAKEGGHTLNAATHKKLQKLIQKAIHLNAFDRVPLDDLLQYLKLCDSALRHTTDLDFGIGGVRTAEGAQSWLDQAGNIELAFQAARTALLVMSGGREDRQLYSEDIICLCLDLFGKTMNGVITPVVELRDPDPLFKLLVPHKKAVGALFVTCQSVYALLEKLAASVELSDQVMNSLESVSTTLMFVENAHSEKDSVAGVPKFDGLRLVAMDTLCHIFLAKEEQRQSIVDQILSSLGKLPVGRQNARQFKLAGGASIQPVSALVMRLVQVSSGMVKDGVVDSARPVLGAGGSDDDDGGEGANAVETATPRSRKKPGLVSAIRSEKDAERDFETSINDLASMANTLTGSAKHNASRVIEFLVSRALNSTKSGENPYRNLLDQFVDDFTVCLDSPEWPAAELLLRSLMSTMVSLAEGEKTPAPSKNMALEILGTMGAAISKLRSHVRQTATSFCSSSTDDLGRHLGGLADAALARTMRTEQVVDWQGPYRMALEYLESRRSEDPGVASAVSFLVADWSRQTCAGYHLLTDENSESDKEFGRLAYRLRTMLEDRHWLATEFSFETVLPAHAHLAYSIVLLHSRLFGSFGQILNMLLSSMASDQATVRSKSLKSINQVLETDPSILDGESAVVDLIFRCSGDPSPQVRDSALGLMGKCIGMRPALQSKMLPTILERFVDNGLAVRKRAVRLARDIYLRNQDTPVRSTIANGLFQRVQDPDEGVRELAKQVIEEVWFVPFYVADKDAAYKSALAEHVALVIQTVKSGGNAVNVLDKVFRSILDGHGHHHHHHQGGAAAAAAANTPFSVCAELVANLFDLVEHLDSDDPLVPSGKDALQVLMLFAKADPALFTFDQVKLLEPHTRKDVDRAVLRAIMVIYRRVLPTLTDPAHNVFLQAIRNDLSGVVSTATRQLLDDLVACLWIISVQLRSRATLAHLTVSTLVGLKKLSGGGAGVQAASSPETIQRLVRYMGIAGMVGKHCHLDGELSIFKDKIRGWEYTSVSRGLVCALVPFAAEIQHIEVRRAALDAIGLVCQSSPRNYIAVNVYATFQRVFEQADPSLECSILTSFREFLAAEETRAEAAHQALKRGKGPAGKKKELTVMGGTNYDDVASATTQRFLGDITRIALSGQDEHAFAALGVLASISRQGLVHPKETAVPFMVLETSPNRSIAELAHQEHRLLHEKHESTLEREYGKTVQLVFDYQRDVVKDPRGATTNPFQSKLHLMLEVFRNSTTKHRQKFLEKLCSLIQFDPAALDVGGSGVPPHVELSRFLVENLAYLEYSQLGDVDMTVRAMEKLAVTIGAPLTHAMESELFVIAATMEVDARLGGRPEEDRHPAPRPVHANVEPGRLRRLASSAVILLVLWETRTYLRRLYNLGTNRREGRAKLQGKDSSKAPVKVQGIHGDKIWEEISAIVNGLQSQELMVERCKAFVDLMNIDRDFKALDEDDDMDDDDAPTTPSDHGQEAPEATPEANGRGRKRKSLTTPGGRKKRARSDAKPAKPRGRPRKQPLAAPEPNNDDPGMDLD